MSVTWALDAGDGVRGVGIDVVVPAASTVKPLIAVALWQEVRAGRIDPDELVPEGYALAGGNSLVDALPGIRLRLRDAAALMLAVSDNTTSNVLLDRLGFDRVNEQADALGLAATRLGRRFMDAAAIEAGAENWTSAGDLVRLLRALAVPGRLPDDVRLPVLAALAVSQHLDVLGEVVPEDQLLGVKAGSHERALHDTALVGPPGAANWPRAELANWPSGELAGHAAIWPIGREGIWPIGHGARWPSRSAPRRRRRRTPCGPPRARCSSRSSASRCVARRPRCCRSCRGSAPGRRTGPPAPGSAAARCHASPVRAARPSACRASPRP